MVTLVATIAPLGVSSAPHVERSEPPDIAARLLPWRDAA